MARTAARPVNKTDDPEENLIEDGEWQEGAESTASAAVISDSRRRRMLKRGETLPEAPTPSEGKGRPTPSQRDRDAEPAREGNIITRTVANFREYMEDTISELQKVSWPSREETLRLTYIVLAATVVTAVLLGIISFVFSLLTQQVANPETATFFGIITVALIVVVALAWLFRDRLPGLRS